MCYLFVLWFPYISIYVKRELNVTDSGTVVLVMTILVESRRVTQGYPLWAVLYRPDIT